MKRDEHETPRGMAQEPDWRLGSELSHATQQDALRQFVNRCTRQLAPHRKGANPVYFEGGLYPLQFDSDADWLAHTHFAVTKSGKLDKRVRHCESSPTWPDNPELALKTIAATPSDIAANKGVAPCHLARINENGKFEGERVAVFMAYQRSLDGFAQDSFGDSSEGGFYARVMFDASPHIVCFVETESGFVREVTNAQFEAANADYIEQLEQDEGN